MQAYELSAFGFENLKIVDKPKPTAGPYQVVLKVRACSLNYRDLMIVKGHYNPKLKMPAVPLSDGMGEVVEVGPGVTRVKVGDRVAAAFMPKWVAGEIDEAKARSALGGGGPDGMLAEYVAIHEEGVVHVPAHLSDEEARRAPLRRGHGLARTDRRRRAQGRRYGAGPGHRRRVDLRPAIRPAARRPRNHHLQ